MKIKSPSTFLGHACAQSILVCLLLSASLATYAEEISKKHLTVSFIIPCHYKHFKYLEGLLDILCKQTVLPNEVIISLSEVSELGAAAVEDLEKKLYPFPFTIIKHREALSAGANRNCCCDASTGDIIIANDADDLPHIQRVELIRHAFEEYPAAFIVHGGVRDEKRINLFQLYDANKIDVYKLNGKLCDWINGWPIWHAKIYTYKYDQLIYGCPAIKRKTIEKVKWPDKHIFGEDCIFAREFFDKIGSMFIIDANLYLYRAGLGGLV